MFRQRQTCPLRRELIQSTYLRINKGKIPSPTIYYLDSPQSEGYTCNSTLVYPGAAGCSPTLNPDSDADQYRTRLGQTSGAISLNSSFQYQALNNFAYQGEALTNCAVANATYLDVVGPPISWPRFGWNHTCKSGYCMPSFFERQLTSHKWSAIRKGHSKPDLLSQSCFILLELIPPPNHSPSGMK